MITDLAVAGCQPVLQVNPVLSNLNVPIAGTQPIIW